MMVNPLRGIIGNNSNSAVQQFKNDFASYRKNPFQFLLSKNLNIPQELQNDPERITQYLLNNGTMNQNTYNKLTQFVNGMGNANKG